MATLFIVLGIGAIIALLFTFGFLKSIKMLFVFAILILLGFAGYAWLHPISTESSGPAIFRGPINIHIVPPQDSTDKPKSSRDTEEKTAQEYFGGTSVRDPFQAPGSN